MLYTYKVILKVDKFKEHRRIGVKQFLLKFFIRKLFEIILSQQYKPVNVTNYIANIMKARYNYLQQHK